MRDTVILAGNTNQEHISVMIILTVVIYFIYLGAEIDIMINLVEPATQVDMDMTDRIQDLIMTRTTIQTIVTQEANMITGDINMLNLNHLVITMINNQRRQGLGSITAITMGQCINVIMSLMIVETHQLMLTGTIESQPQQISDTLKVQVSKGVSLAV